jgi:putative ABC transport system permease protein
MPTCIVQGGRAGFAEGVYPVLARDAAVAVASPVIQVEATVAGRDDTLTLIGLDALRAAAVTPGLVGEAADRLDVLRPDVVFVTPAAAAWLRVEPGDVVTLQSGVALVPLRVAGLVHGDASARLAVMDVAGLQDRFERVGYAHARRPARAPRRRPAATARARLAPRLPPGVSVRHAAQHLESTAR